MTQKLQEKIRVVIQQDKNAKEAKFESVSCSNKIQLMKQQLLDIRLRKKLIPIVPNPKIVDTFIDMHLMKSKKFKKMQLQNQIEVKKKQYLMMRKRYQQQREKYEMLKQTLNQRLHLSKILTSKLENQYQKTRQRYKEIDFNQTIITAIKKVSYYRLAQIILNQQARGIFGTLDNIAERQSSKNQQKSDEQLGVFYGYIGLLITLVSSIANFRLWIVFNFKGPKSTIRLNDGTLAVLNPKQKRIGEGLKLLTEQLFQILKYGLGINVESSLNLYQLCEQLSKFLMS